MTVLQRIRDLAALRGISLAELERQTKLSSGSITKWDKSSPSADKLDKIASFFDVSVDYLLGRTNRKDPWPASTPEEDFADLEDETPEFFEIQRESRRLNRKDQKRLLNIMKATFEEIDNGNFEEDDDDDL